MICNEKHQENISAGDGRLRSDSRLSHQLVACILSSELTLCNYKVGTPPPLTPWAHRGGRPPTAPTLLVAELEIMEVVSGWSRHCNDVRGRGEGGEKQGEKVEVEGNGERERGRWRCNGRRERGRG